MYAIHNTSLLEKFIEMYEKSIKILNIAHTQIDNLTPESEKVIITIFSYLISKVYSFFRIFTNQLFDKLLEILYSQS
jgi:hypothetical protein